MEILSSGFYGTEVRGRGGGGLPNRNWNQMANRFPCEKMVDLTNILKVFICCKYVVNDSECRVTL